jgi:hypothetical protein
VPGGFNDNQQPDGDKIVCEVSDDRCSERSRFFANNGISEKSKATQQRPNRARQMKQQE